MRDNDEQSNYGEARLAARRLVAMNVTELRIVRRWSQADLAHRSGVTERTVADIEAGAGEMLIDTLSSLADGLNVDVSYFFRNRKDDVQ